MGRHEAPESASDRPEHEVHTKKRILIRILAECHELALGGATIMLFDQSNLGEHFAVLMHHVPI